jgi:hypothetical protein
VSVGMDVLIYISERILGLLVLLESGIGSGRISLQLWCAKEEVMEKIVLLME